MYDKELKLRITGEVPLIMHNGEMRNPLNPIVQQIKVFTGKRKKTEADLEQISKLEWYGGIYVSNGNVIIPGEAWEGTFRSAARTKKRGKDVERALLCDDSVLEHDGPKKIDDLWKDSKFRLVKSVLVQRNAVMRTRPKFDKWSTSVSIRYDSSVLNEADVLDFAQIAGDQIGILDWRPKYGRFSVEKSK